MSVHDALDNISGQHVVDSNAGWKSDDDHFFVVLFHYPFVKTAFGKNIRKREKLYLIINFSKEYLIEFIIDHHFDSHAQ